MPHKFWDEAVSTAVYLINRLPTPILHSFSPYERLFRKPPDYTILRTFGCACYPYLRPYAPHKLAPRSERCLFLGYSALHLGYRCLSLSTGRLHTSRHVVLDESVFPLAGGSPGAEVPNIAASPGAGLLGPFPGWSIPPPPASADVPPPVAIVDVVPPADAPVRLPSPAAHAHGPPVPAVRDAPAVATTGDAVAHADGPPTQSPVGHDGAGLAPPLADANSSPPARTRSLTDIYASTPAISTHALMAQKHSLPMCFAACTNVEPTCFSQASKDPAWRTAMAAEFDALLRNGTWSLVPR